MLYKQFMALHMIDRSDRWHAGCQIESKTTDALCEAVETTWCQIWGPFKNLVIDGESGINAGATKVYLERLGI